MKILIYFLLFCTAGAGGYSCYRHSQEAEHYKEMAKPATMPADFYAEKAAWEGKPAPTQ